MTRLTKPVTREERQHARTRTYGNSYAAAILPRLLDDLDAADEVRTALSDALKQIREMGYSSQAARCTDTVLACVRVADEAIGAAEKSA